MGSVLPRVAGPRTTLALTAVVVLAAAVVGAGKSAAAPAPYSGLTGPTGSLLVDVYDCGANWTSATPGQQTLTLYNDGTQAAEVDLVNPKNGAVYGEFVGLGPETSDQMSVNLGDGDYAFYCVPADADPVTGPTVHVSGATAAQTAAATPGVVPVTRQDMTVLAKQYEAYVTAGLNTLLSEVQQLSTDIAAGNLAAARTDWLTAHMQYNRLGGAYDAFGDLGDSIDGLATDLPGGVNGSSFAGFHRIELGLWSGQSAAALAGPASGLVANVQSLIAAFPTEQVDPLDVGLRTHEILEDAVRFELSGQSDEGSDTSLATVSANIDGTETLLSILTPTLTPRYPALPQVQAALAHLRTLVDAQHAADGTWTPLSQLTEAQREAINSAAGNAVELLAPIATICEPRMTGPAGGSDAGS
ncbi:MAG TPA: EfeM/EfeO family lipoprotein [Actinocrinis sp.]|nr:EfeM/EfeO family lipoprotein [Actinocrinis sp.]